MSFIENTAFQNIVTNTRNNDTQIIAGRFYSGTTQADCSAGWLCNRGAIDSDGVSKMTQAADGSLPLYACFCTDVPRLLDNHGNLYAVGVRTLGLGLPAGRIGSFEELLVGEMYAFGDGNLNTMLGNQKYFTVSAGGLSPATAAPTSGYYFTLIPDLCEEVFTEGNLGTMSKIVVMLCKA